MFSTVSQICLWVQLLVWILGFTLARVMMWVWSVKMGLGPLLLVLGGLVVIRLILLWFTLSDCVAIESEPFWQFSRRLSWRFGLYEWAVNLGLLLLFGWVVLLWSPGAALFLLLNLFWPAGFLAGLAVSGFMIYETKPLSEVKREEIADEEVADDDFDGVYRGVLERSEK